MWYACWALNNINGPIMPPPPNTPPSSRLESAQSISTNVTTQDVDHFFKSIYPFMTLRHALEHPELVDSGFFMKGAREAIRIFNAFIHCVEDPSQVSQSKSGIPYTLKANLGIKDTQANFGLPITFKHTRTSPMARIIQSLNGTEFIGYTTTSGFAMHNYAPGTKNPISPEHTVGGSSGGAAVAAALRMALLNPGTDFGGSIRMPAAYLGIFGYKAGPTNGLFMQKVLDGDPIDSQNIDALITASEKELETPPKYGCRSASFLASTIEDIILSVALSLGQDPLTFLKEIQKQAIGQQTVRIGIVKTLPTANPKMQEATEQEYAAVQDMADRLQKSGMNVEFIEINPDELSIGSPKDIYKSYHAMVGRLTADFNDTLKEQGFTDEEICQDADQTGTFRHMYIKMGELLQQQANDSPKEIDKHLQVMRQLRDKLDEVVANHGLDFIISPTLERRAAEGELYPTPEDNKRYQQLIQNPNLEGMLNEAATRTFNDAIHALSVNPMGRAAIAIPNPKTNNGLGSVQLIAATPAHEARLLSTALSISQHLDLGREVPEVLTKRAHDFMLQAIEEREKNAPRSRL